MEKMRNQAGLKFVLMDTMVLALCVMTSGINWMQELCVDNWDSQMKVSLWKKELLHLPSDVNS